MTTAHTPPTADELFTFELQHIHRLDRLLHLVQEMEARAGRWQAERAVLDAVADWVAGRASQGRIAEAYDELQVVLAANGM